MKICLKNSPALADTVVSYYDCVILENPLKYKDYEYFGSFVKNKK
jgi:hypothetical protein